MASSSDHTWMLLRDSISRPESIPKSFLLVGAGTFAVYLLVKFTYNLFFHPLSHIPGPWLAGASYLPEFYYDVLRSGRYTRKIIEMHEKYGRRLSSILPH